MLSTLSVENAVSVHYGKVTSFPIGTFTRQFNRLRRRNSGIRKNSGAFERRNLRNSYEFRYEHVELLPGNSLFRGGDVRQHFVGRLSRAQSRQKLAIGQ